MTDKTPFAENTEQPAGQEPTKDEKILACIGYITIFVLTPLIPILLKKESRYCQHHGKQALLLSLLLFILKFTWITFMFAFFGLLEFVAIVLLVVMTWQGKWFKIPFLFDFSQKIPL